MSRALLVALVLVAATAPDLRSAPDAAAGPTALVGGRVYTSPDAPPLDDAVIVVDGARIASVARRSEAVIPEGAARIDCRGLVITAAFQNSHVHFTEPHWADAEGQPAEALHRHLQSMLTRWGFTTVVDTASLLPNTVALRRRIETGEVPGPRILTAGIALYPPDGIPYYVRESVPAELLKLIPQPRTGADAGDVVRRNLDSGADLVKLFTGSWVERERVLPMPGDIATGAVGEAHRRGRLVFAHPSDIAGLEVALEAKVDVLAHAIDDTRGLTAAHLRRMRDQHVAFVPTLMLLASRSPRPEVLDQVREYAAIDGRIVFGTDVGFLTHYDPAGEYDLMASSGLTWRQVLASLTTEPAALFRESERRGRIAQGLDADLVALGRDPAADARAFSDVRLTMRAGRILHAAPGADE